jgi:ABC-type transporter Mla subunit MlaD
MTAFALPMRDNPQIKSFLTLLDTPEYQSERQGFISLMDYTDTLSEQYNTIIKELADLKERLGDMGDKKNPLTAMVEYLSGIIAGIGDKLKAIKDSIINFAQNTLESVKDKGLSAVEAVKDTSVSAYETVRDKSISTVGAVANTLHIHEGLETIGRSLYNAAAKVENIENFYIERVESKLLEEFELPANFNALSKDDLREVYAKLLDIGMNADLSLCEYKIVQDLLEAIEDTMPEINHSFEQSHETELEAEQGEEM